MAIVLLVVFVSLFIPTSQSSDKDCVTVGGYDIGATCIFPFYYNTWNDTKYIPSMVLGWLAKLNPRRIRFDSCTTYRNYGKKWCATNVTQYNDYIPGHWGLCPKSMECDKLKEPWINKLGSVKHETYGERKIASANKENKPKPKIPCLRC